MARCIREFDIRSAISDSMGRIVIGGIIILALAACDPGSGQSVLVPESVNQADYERHKANRESYMYQGF